MGRGVLVPGSPVELTARAALADPGEPPRSAPVRLDLRATVLTEPVGAEPANLVVRVLLGQHLLADLLVAIVTVADRTAAAHLVHGTDRMPLAPLLEEERHAGGAALVADRAHPVGVHGP